MTRMRTVGEVAALAGTTVRTLHHYDDIGLLEPSVRSSTGYRMYSESDIVRLHSIMHWRTLGLGLDEIAELIDAPDVDLAVGLKRQLERVREHADDVNEMIAAIETAIESIEAGGAMTEESVRKLFDGFDPAVHESEVNERWGATPSYRESQRRVATYTPDDWQRYKAENGSNVERFARLLADGVAPEDPEAIDAAREHGALIDRWFYPLDPDAHLGLAEGYVADPRFEANYESVATGLARYVRDAIRALHDH